MATLNVRTQGLDRSDLALVFKDFRVLKAFENMVTDVSVTIPSAIDDQSDAIAAAQAAADAAQLSADAAQATADAALTSADAAQTDVNALEARAQPIALVDAPIILVDASLHNAFSVTLGGNRALAAPSGLTDGQVVYFAIRQDGTGGRTLSFASIYDFGSAGTPTLSTATDAVDLVLGYYDQFSNKILAIFRKQATSVSTVSYFSAHNNGVAQSIPNSAFTQLTLGTTAFNVGGNFAASAWTPPAGRLVKLSGAAFFPVTVAGSVVTVAVFKNGVEFKRSNVIVPGGSASVSVGVDCMDIASGLDTYDLRAYQGTGTAQNTNGAANLTWFQGSTITP